MSPIQSPYSQFSSTQPSPMAEESATAPSINPKGWLDTPLSNISIGTEIFAIALPTNCEFLFYNSSEPAILLEHKPDQVLIQLPNGSFRYFKNDLLAAKNSFEISSIFSCDDPHFNNILSSDLSSPNEEIRNFSTKKIINLNSFDPFLNNGISESHFLTRDDICNIPWKKIAKTAGLFFIAVSAFFLIDDLSRINFKNFQNKAIKINNRTKIPSSPKILPHHTVEFFGHCSRREKLQALDERNRLDKLAEEESEQRGIRNAEISAQKIDREIALINEEFAERLRRATNPTPEEIEIDEKILIAKILKYHPDMELYLRKKYPKHFNAIRPAITCDENCQKLSRKILQVGENANCAEIKKQFRTLSLKAHPDKNPNGDESSYHAITEAYEHLCSYNLC